MDENKVKKQPVSLKSLLTPMKTVGIEFPGMEGFEIKLTYLAREELLKLRNRSVKQVLNKRTRAYEEQLDNDKFLVEYAKAVVYDNSNSYWLVGGKGSVNTLAYSSKAINWVGLGKTVFETEVAISNTLI